MERDHNIDLSELSNELIKRKYLFNKADVNGVISIQDYLAMHIIVDINNSGMIYQGKAYLKDIAEKMHLTIRQTSKISNSLKDKGLIRWSHEGDGSDGTFVEITDEGRQFFEQQKSVLEEFYGRVIKRFGKDNLVQLLNLMKQFETIVSSEMEVDIEDAES